MTDKALAPEISKKLQIRAAILADIDKRFTPHRGQKIVLHAIHVLGCTFVFVQCGRKWGKTEIELRSGVENCVLPINEGETTLYTAYEDDQAKKIVWLEGRILKFCNPQWIHKVYDSDMRVVFKNGRSLIVDGSNNYKKHEGIRPSMLLCDEFKRFKPEFWHAMEPNLSVYNAPVIFAGSPPEGPCQYVDMAEFVRKLQAETGEGYFTQQPSWMNDETPGLIQWLKNRKKQYESRGELHVWDREYGAIYSPSGSRLIYPNYNRVKVGRSSDFLLNHVKKHAKEWDWVCSADPANDDPFAVVFVAVHRTTRQVAVVDGIYETDRALKTVKAIWAQIEQKVRKWNPNFDDWNFIHDDQASWFGAEFQSQVPNELAHKPAWTPAGKLSRSKDSAISVVNGLIAADSLWVNNEFDKFHWEHERWQTDEKSGKPKKLHDHTCDAFRYVLVHLAYDPNKILKVEVPVDAYADPWLMQAIKSQEDIDSEKLLDDWTQDMFSDWAADL